MDPRVKSADDGQGAGSTSSEHPLRFVVIIGIANLFADMTYEGARSITGPFLQMLGASAPVVGFTAGFGELVGYALRSVAGFIGDRTGRYWLMAIMGYAINGRVMIVKLGEKPRARRRRWRKG